MSAPAQRPSVGRVVHYVSHGTPPRRDGSQAFPSQCRAALVTEVDESDPARIGLFAVNPTGVFFHSLADGGSTHAELDAPAGDPNCAGAATHGEPFRYCPCGWREPSYRGGSWHWPERVE